MSTAPPSEENKADKKEDIKVEILNENERKYDLSFKVILIGNQGVGKSCLTIASNNPIQNEYLPTIGFEYFTFNVKINEKIIKLQIWDTCGQELYRSLVVNFYRNTSVGVIVYSIDDKNSFENVILWLKDLKLNSNNIDIRTILVGNKSDLEENRQVSKEEGLKLKNDFEFDLFMETSAKTGFNVKKIFIEAAKILYLDYVDYKKKNILNVAYVDYRDSTIKGEKLKNDILKNPIKRNKCC